MWWALHKVLKRYLSRHENVHTMFLPYVNTLVIDTGTSYLVEVSNVYMQSYNIRIDCLQLPIL